MDGRDLLEAVVDSVCLDVVFVFFLATADAFLFRPTLCVFSVSALTPDVVTCILSALLACAI